MKSLLNCRLNAENLKQNGNELYKQKKYQEALEMYSEAIRLLPCAAYYGNRSATYMMLNKYKDALADAQQSTSIDKEFTKVSVSPHRICYFVECLCDNKLLYLYVGHIHCTTYVHNLLRCTDSLI